ncbi:response regulator transcription factor [Tissierella carlieri]|jgi:two-component system KDP operon response regulator KdpE|uniref:response regulator transcription factor n=1 Tax=Tissierella carlieri TaxID=689904 RepID=UPI0028051247|nr:response regulator transcription factor [uncultured Tissierella sp.]MDU5083127.1 response regulator transcription factor [Bacillota bacterium]
MKNKHVIMIVEDEEAISEFISVKLELQGYRTLKAVNGQEAISLASSHCPDLILLDLGLPDMDGMEVIESIRSWSLVPVIIVSARHEEKFIISALDSGADDYITKPFNNAILMARIRTALRKGHISKIKNSKINQSFSLGDLYIDYDKRIVTVAEKAVHLTPIEYRIIVLLSLNAGTVLTHEFLCRELWGPYVSKSKALRVNVANLRRKIEKNTADPQYILTEMGVGYRMLEEV